MRVVELRRPIARVIRRKRRLAGLALLRHVAERSPHPFERSRLGIEDDHAAVAIAIADEQLVRFGMDPDRRRPIHVLRVGVASALAATSDLHNELAVLRELEQVMVAIRLVPRDPDVPVMRGKDPVLRARPLVTEVSRPAPGLDDVARWIDFPYGRRGNVGRPLGFRGARAVQNPHVILCVDMHIGYLPQDPIVRRLQPRWVDLEYGYFDRRRLACRGGDGLTRPLFATPDDRDERQQLEPRGGGAQAATNLHLSLMLRSERQAEAELQ